MKLILDCLDCGQRNELAGLIFDPCEVEIVCAGCELTLIYEVTAADLAASWAEGQWAPEPEPAQRGDAA